MTGLTDFPRHSPALAQEFRDAGFWNDDRLADYLERWATETPDKVAIAAPDRDITYAEWRDRSRRFANALLGLGLKRGDVVAIQYPNHPEFLIAFLGVAMMGGVLCTLHMPYRAGEMAPLMNHSRARAVICTAGDEKYDAPATMAGLKAQVPSLEHIIVIGGRGAGLDFDTLIDGAPDDPVADPPAPDDPVILCFTSGTSASPKGVVRTHETFTSNLRIYPQTIGLTAGDRVLVAPPFTHVFGLSCGMLGLCHGATNVLMSLFSPELYADRLVNGRPTVVFSAPAHVAATIKAGLLDGVDLGSIRDVIVAGSVCPPEVAADLERRMPNGRTGQLFGMTETILIMQTPLDAPPEIRHTSTGRKTGGIEVRVANPEDDTEVPNGGEGELQLAGYSIFPGYLNNPEANAGAFAADGFFRTGDLATVDADGNVVIIGRVKDVINRGGIKINPTDVENLLQAHPAIVLAAVVPMPDDVLGERLCLFVTLAPGAGLTFEEMTGYLEANGVAKMRWPERLEIVDEMPMTPTRKIQKGELAKLVA
ncbi:MAG: class I adenylate-forming enzyme family protein [Rhodospirillaceae bacterium]|nr:class I adenylate-forming enzyme family protein [Rhodospirillaceae bacterium]MDE0616674.1 class I adenylate-forming enzyme family protein [Rhodospirillaceae bacterium]